MELPHHYCAIASRHLPLLLFEQMRCVRDRRAGPHSSCDDRCFGQHCVICTGLARCLYVQFNTVWALRRQCIQRGWIRTKGISCSPCCGSAACGTRPDRSLRDYTSSGEPCSCGFLPKRAGGEWPAKPRSRRHVEVPCYLLHAAATRKAFDACELSSLPLKHRVS